YCRIFKANNVKGYTDPAKPIFGLLKIGFYYQIPNITAAEETSLGIASITVQLSARGFNPLLYPNQNKDNIDEAIKSHLMLQRNFIPAMAGYCGLETSYNEAPFLESEVSQFPLNKNPYNMPVGTTGYFSVAAQSFIQEQTVEQ
ncbi:7535_t:CDS:2, partial [Racocetra fulgida]